MMVKSEAQTPLRMQAIVCNSFSQKGYSEAIFWHSSFFGNSRIRDGFRFAQKMAPTKESFKDRTLLNTRSSLVEFLQQRLNAFRPEWTPGNLKWLFIAFGVIFAVIAVPLLFVAGEVHSFVSLSILGV